LKSSQFASIDFDLIQFVDWLYAFCVELAPRQPHAGAGRNLKYDKPHRILLPSDSMRGGKYPVDPPSKGKFL